MSIIIVEPTSSGVALVEAARRMGEVVWVFTADQDDRKISARCRKIANHVVAVDTNDVTAMVCAARKIRETTVLKAIIPGFEYAVDVVARAASELGLLHLSIAAASLTRNKFSSREKLKSLGLDVPRYAQIKSYADVAAACAEVGFPAVVKPVDGCGSLLVRRVDSQDELHAVLNAIANTEFFDMGKQIGVHLLLEEFLVGREYSIEGYIDQARPHVVAVTEKQLGAEPFFVEMGHVVPARLTPTDHQALVSYIEKVVRGIGLELGVFHAEARITKRGPILIEIAARLGGDCIYRLVELTQGLSLPATMIRSYIGLPNPAVVDPCNSRSGVAGVRFLSLNRSGPLGHVKGLEEVRTMAGYQELDLYFTAGDIIPELTDFRGRLGHILFTADERIILDARLRKAENGIEYLQQAS